LKRYKRLVETDPNVPQTLFTKVFKAEKGDDLSFNEFRDEASGFAVAGTNTTANTLKFLFWSVCQDADTKVLLVKELNALPPSFTDDDLRPLRYLNQLIHETLRMYASVS
jgi:cytochrome P450